MWSWAGQDLTATITTAAGDTQLVMGGSIAKGGNPFGGGQVVAWGEKARLITRFVDEVIAVLPTIMEPKVTPTPSQAGKALWRMSFSKLAQLRDSGVLTEEEFAAQKAKLLS